MRRTSTPQPGWFQFSLSGVLLTTFWVAAMCHYYAPGPAVATKFERLRFGGRLLVLPPEWLDPPPHDRLLTRRNGVLVAYYGGGTEFALATAFTAIVFVMFWTRPKPRLTGKAHLKALGRLLVGDIGRARIGNSNTARRWHRWPVHGVPHGHAGERKRGTSLAMSTQPAAEPERELPAASELLSAPGRPSNP
jgi:hypothetical protein